MTKSSPLAQRIAAVRLAVGASFTQLVAIAGLDRSKAFRFADLSGVDLRDQDLHGFDFTGADFRRALLEGASFKGAITDAAVFAAGEVSSTLQEDLTSMSQSALVKLLRRLDYDEAMQTYVEIEDIDRSSPILLSELVGLAPSEELGIASVRRFFQLDWAGPRSYQILKRLIAKDFGLTWLVEAIDLTGYAPANPSQVETLLKQAQDFDVANLVYQRFERFCSVEHLIALGRHVRSPADYPHLHGLAGRFSSGQDQELIALRALPSAVMVRYALNHYVHPDIARLSQVRIIFAEKAERAEEALALLRDMDDGVTSLKRIVTAAMDSLRAHEALHLMRSLSHEDSPLRVGGSIRTGLLVTLYLKRSDADWRFSVFREFLQWQLSPLDLSERRIRSMFKFPDLVELAAMFAAIHSFDLQTELLPFTSSQRDTSALECGIVAVQQAGGEGILAIVEAYRANFKAARSWRHEPA